MRGLAMRGWVLFASRDISLVPTQPSAVKPVQRRAARLNSGTQCINIKPAIETVCMNVFLYLQPS